MWKRIANRKLNLAALTVVLMSSAAAQAEKRPAPTRSIVLVHGAFADGSSWDRVTEQLQAKGYNVVAVHEPLSSLADDVAATKRVIEAQPGEVVLVGHSYGGAVITEAGAMDKVVSLVYVAAFAPDAGESINDLGRGQPPPPWLASLQVDSAGFARLPPETIARDFAQDLPRDEARLVAAKQGPISVGCFDAKLTTAAWKTKPSWYVRAADDRMIDPGAQSLMAQRMRATISSVEASHVVMLSRPRQVTAVILDAAAGNRSSNQR